MSRLLKGKPVADALTAQAMKRAEALREQGVVPKLAIVRIGERPDDLTYERNACKRCTAVGIETCLFALPPDCSQQQVLETIHQINSDDSIHGCLILRPLPSHLDEQEICNALDPQKDVDGATRASLLGTLAGLPIGFTPCTAEACIRLLDYYDVPIEGACVTVVGRSDVIGKPVAARLQQRNATVTVAHSRTRDLAQACRNADIIVTATGQPRLVSAMHLAAHQTVIDVGINWDEATESLVGDVDFEAAEALVSALTPVPGGVGSVTTAVLATHVIEAAEHAARMSQ